MTLTDFLIALTKATPAKIARARADPGPVAAKYGIPVETVVGYLEVMS